jgi:hypothetical protein
MLTKGDLVNIKNKQGTITKISGTGKNKKYRVKIEFSIGAREWDFKESYIKKYNS